MFDNLRRQSAQETTQEQEEEENSGPVFQPAATSSARASAPRRRAGFLGLTPVQRFVLALMLFLNVTVLGCFALIAFERINLPF